MEATQAVEDLGAAELPVELSEDLFAAARSVGALQKRGLQWLFDAKRAACFDQKRGVLTCGDDDEVWREP